MKKLLIILNILALSSCSDFLKEEPRDEMSSDQFFSVPEHAHAAVNSLYRNGVPQVYTSAASYGGARAMLGQYMSGFFDNEYKGQEPHVQNSMQLTLNGTNMATYLGNTWADVYRGISRANNAIKYIPETPGLSESAKNNLLAEARFFRAFGYYYLVRMFGGVPIITEPYESLESLYVARADVKEVYELIVSDLSFAVNEGGLSQSSMGNNNNRISETTAAGLLSEVYLTMSGYPLQENRFAEAAEMARKVINSGSYSLVSHDIVSGEVDLSNSAYNKIRKSDKSSNEYLYFVEFEGGISNSNYPVYTYPVSMTSDVAYGITNGAYQPVDSFLWGYDEDQDLRIQEKQYFHSIFVTSSGATKTFATAPFMWHDDQAIYETATSGKDFVAYSYSDILLIAAEAIANSEGVTDEAVQYLAEVRSRAYWNTERTAVVSSLSSLSAENFVEEVLKERYRELVFEFQLWYDIQRTRKFPVTSENNKGEISYVNVIGQENNWGRAFQERHLLFPIPETELQRNPSLEQNPGYN